MNQRSLCMSTRLYANAAYHFSTPKTFQINYPIPRIIVISQLFSPLSSISIRLRILLVIRPHVVRRHGRSIISSRPHPHQHLGGLGGKFALHADGRAVPVEQEWEGQASNSEECRDRAGPVDAQVLVHGRREQRERGAEERS